MHVSSANVAIKVLVVIGMLDVYIGIETDAERFLAEHLRKLSFTFFMII